MPPPFIEGSASVTVKPTLCLDCYYNTVGAGAPRRIPRPGPPTMPSRPLSFREDLFPDHLLPRNPRFYSSMGMGGGECKPSEKAHPRQPGAWKACSLTL